MSRIDKMMIQGIRSFGPEERDKQCIKFFTPLTLILGPNGTGKTTIIECLKYISTGEFPPGAAKGGAFVHDPKIANETEVRGQVKLGFHDVTGAVVVVTRSLQVTQKLKTQTCKTLENAIQRKDKHGETRSLSSKCADVDLEMIASLGVSKAVLENVIFCHQEESNWPLGEGKSVKTRFDDIFASTRYVKALETIRKLRKEQGVEIRLNQNNMLHLKKHKDRAAELQKELDDAHGRNASAMDSLRALRENISPIEEKLTEIEDRSRDIFKLQSRIDKNQSEQKEMERTRDDMERNIEREFQGSMDELKRALDDFQTTARRQKADLSKNEARMDRLSEELEKVNRKRSELLTDQGKLQHEAKVQAENIEKRNKLIKTYADHYQFSGFLEIGEGSVERFMEKLKAKKENFMHDARNLKTTFDERENKIQGKIDDVRDSKTKLEQTQHMKTNQIVQHKAEIKRLSSELQRVEASAGNLETIQRDINLKSRQLEDTEKEVDLDQLRAEVKSLQTERTDLDRKVKDLDSEVGQLVQESEVRTQLDLLKKDKTTKEDHIKRLKNRHEETFKHLFDEMPTSGFRGKVDDYIQTIGRNIQNETAKVQQARVKHSQLETQCRMTRDQLKGKEDEMKEYDDQLFELCGSQDFEEGVNKLQDKIKVLRGEKGPLEGTKYMFERYVNLLKKKDPVCPLCKREFDEQHEIEELIEELQRNMTLLPSKLDGKEKELTQCTEKYERMVQMKPRIESRASLSGKDIPELRDRIKTLSSQIDEINTEITAIDEGITMMQSDESLVRNVQPDAVMLDRYQSEIRQLDKDIAKNDSRLSGGTDSGRNIESVRNEKAEKQMMLDQVSQQLEYKRDKINRQTERIHDLKQSLNELKSEKLQIESDLQKRIKLEENKQKLTEDCLTLEDEVHDAKEQARPLDEKIAQLKAEKEKILSEKDVAIDEAKRLMEKLKEHGSSIAIVQKEINRYISEKREEKLEVCQDQLVDLDRTQSKLKREDDDVGRIIDEIKDDLANQQVRERELDDNIKLRGKREQIAALGRQIAELQEKIGGFDVMNLDRQKRELQSQLQDYTQEKHTVEGRQQGLKEKVVGLQRDLKSDDYKDATKKYQNELINVKTMEVANQDLDRYGLALDWAIMRYHTEKMKEINDIMRELWRNTYRGNDIDTIEIRTDEDTTVVSSSARRVYHYRVVMVKGDAVIDMRSRCSAGQKVLASLIIRLALAETFCHKCGILALDEPTTNLDRENIESLAYALVEIIKSRHVQRNFQLVVITHDEDFVELLGTSDYVDNFWRIGRSIDGKSIIKIESISTVRK